MNRMIMLGLALAGGTIAFDHLVHELPQWLAIVLYGAGIILFLLGMSRSRMKK